mmetsp:Transcript_48492/g.123029  ORF Transcript_48492/g.123029 Transcript_48492/m.123029 type:complete len:229 (-) Transcript_48492:51-737(-)
MVLIPLPHTPAGTVHDLGAAVPLQVSATSPRMASAVPATERTSLAGGGVLVAAPRVVGVRLRRALPGAGAAALGPRGPVARRQARLDDRRRALRRRRWRPASLPPPHLGIARVVGRVGHPRDHVVPKPLQGEPAVHAPLPLLLVLVPINGEVASPTSIDPGDPEALDEIALSRAIHVDPSALQLPRAPRRVASPITLLLSSARRKFSAAANDFRRHGCFGHAPRAVQA